MKKNKKIAVLLVLLLGFSAPLSSWAYSFNVGPYQSNVDVNEALQEAEYYSIENLITDTSDDIITSTEERFGISEDIWRSASRKISSPRVEIFFDNTNPKPGEKVTVHAVPEFFKNDPQNLYYTWYIIHTENGDSKTALNTISEGKREAAAAMARGDYDPDLDGQAYLDSSRDPDNDGWPAVDSSSYSEDETAAPMGGADGVGGLTEEAVGSLNTSNEWCDSLGDHVWSNCSYHDDSSYLPLNTYFTPYSTQTNYYCDLCADYFSGGGASAYAAATSNRNDCCYSAIPQADLECSETDPETEETTYFKCAQVAGTDYCGTTYNSLFDSCYDTFKEANKSITTTCLDAEYDSCEDDWMETHEDYDDDGFSDYSEQATVGVSRCFAHNFGTNVGASIFMENETSGSSTNDPSGLDYPVSCKHKWVNPSGYKSGSGRFSTGEEERWKTDPVDPDTDGDSFKDEADVIGLGQDALTWNYQPGDRVGVVIEGTSMIPTNEKSSYYKIMWGYLDTCDSAKTGLLSDDACDGSGDYGFGFLATKSPSEQGDDKLKVSLSFTPDNPVADPSDENSENISDAGSISDADQISVTSSLENTGNNPNELYYTWQISKGDPNKDDWSEIKDLQENFDLSSPASGMGISQFSFTPKENALSTDGINYFKVTLTIAYASEQKEGRGRSSVIIPVNTQGVKVSLYEVDIENGKATVGEEICSDGLYRTLCPVVKGQMLAAKVTGSHYKTSESDFSWKISGVQSYEPENASLLFEGWGDASIFFPITKEEQEIEDVSVTATSSSELQPAIGTRLLTVVHPAAFIRSGDMNTSWPKTYTLQDPSRKNNNYDVASSTAFEAVAAEDASFYLDFVPYYLLGDDANTSIDWSINGTSLSDSDFYANNLDIDNASQSGDAQQFSFTVPQNLGSFTNLSVSVDKYWEEDERSIPYTAWGVAPDTLSGESSVTIESVAAPQDSPISSSTNPGQILAAIGTHLPHYFMYLLRIVLTVTVMFVLSAGLFGISQKLSLINDED